MPGQTTVTYGEIRASLKATFGEQVVNIYSLATSYSTYSVPLLVSSVVNYVSRENYCKCMRGANSGITLHSQCTVSSNRKSAFAAGPLARKEQTEPMIL